MRAFRIALVNANTTEATTDRMVRMAQALAPAGVAIEGHTAPGSAPYISTARAAETVADMAKHFSAGNTPDAVMIACFGDPGLPQARKALSVPVLGMADASRHVAAQLGQRFAIVTGGHAWGPMLEAFVKRIGLASRFAGVHTLELTVDMIAADPQGAENIVLEEVCHAHAAGADVVILGGAGPVGFAETLAMRAPVTLLDSLACFVSQTYALTQFGLVSRQGVR